jgi:hypothetical protein
VARTPSRQRGCTRRESERPHTAPPAPRLTRQAPLARSPPGTAAPKPPALSSRPQEEAAAAEQALAEEEGEGDPETYDDADFYQTLLKELLEGGAGALARSAQVG